MKNINLKGITAEAVTGVLILLVALINAALTVELFLVVNEDRLTIFLTS